MDDGVRQPIALVIAVLAERAAGIDVADLAADVVVEHPLPRPDRILRHAQSGIGVVEVGRLAETGHGRAALQHRHQPAVAVERAGRRQPVGERDARRGARVVVLRQRQLSSGVERAETAAEAVIGELRDAAEGGDRLQQQAGLVVDILRDRATGVADTVAGRIHRAVADRGLQQAAHVVRGVAAHRSGQILRSDPGCELCFGRYGCDAQRRDVERSGGVRDRGRSLAISVVDVLRHAAVGRDDEAEQVAPGDVVHITRGERLCRLCRAAAVGIGDAVGRLGLQLVARVEGARDRVAGGVALGQLVAVRVVGHVDRAALAVDGLHEIAIRRVTEARGLADACDRRRRDLDDLPLGVVVEQRAQAHRVDDRRAPCHRVVAEAGDVAERVGRRLDAKGGADLHVGEGDARAVRRGHARDALARADVRVRADGDVPVGDGVVCRREIDRHRRQAVARVVAIVDTGQRLRDAGVDDDRAHLCEVVAAVVVERGLAVGGGDAREQVAVVGVAECVAAGVAALQQLAAAGVVALLGARVAVGPDVLGGGRVVGDRVVRTAAGSRHVEPAANVEAVAGFRAIAVGAHDRAAGRVARADEAQLLRIDAVRPVVAVVVVLLALAVVRAQRQVIEAAAGKDVVLVAQDEIAAGCVDIHLLLAAPLCRVSPRTARAETRHRAETQTQCIAADDRHHVAARCACTPIHPCLGGGE